MAKAGAQIVETQKVTHIEIVTMAQTVVVMDHDRAHRIRERERRIIPQAILPFQLTYLGSLKTRNAAILPVRCSRLMASFTFDLMAIVP